MNEVDEATNDTWINLQPSIFLNTDIFIYKLNNTRKIKDIDAKRYKFIY